MPASRYIADAVYSLTTTPVELDRPTGARTCIIWIRRGPTWTPGDEDVCLLRIGQPPVAASRLGIALPISDQFTWVRGGDFASDVSHVWASSEQGKAELFVEWIS